MQMKSLLQLRYRKNCCWLLVTQFIVQNTIHSMSSMKKDTGEETEVSFFPLTFTLKGQDSFSVDVSRIYDNANLLFSISLYPVTNFLSCFSLQFCLLIIDLYLSFCASTMQFFCFVFDFCTIVLLYCLASLVVIPSSLFFLIKISALQGVLWFHMNLFSISVKNVGAILIRISLKL